MATIIAERATVGDEPGTHHVDCDIFRPCELRKYVRVTYFLEKTSAETYKVVGGCDEGLQLHRIGALVEICGKPKFFASHG